MDGLLPALVVFFLSSTFIFLLWYKLARHRVTHGYVVLGVHFHSSSPQREMGVINVCIPAEGLEASLLSGASRALEKLLSTDHDEEDEEEEFPQKRVGSTGFW